MRFLATFALLLSMNASASKFTNASIVSSGDMSATSIISSPIDVNQLQFLAIQAVFTGSPVGTFKLQISNDLTTIPSKITNWTDYTGSSEDISAAGNFLWNMTLSGYKWVRLVYTKGSGTGTLNATFSGKGI